MAASGPAAAMAPITRPSGAAACGGSIGGGTGPPAAAAALALKARAGAGGWARRTYQGSSSGSTWCRPRRVVDSTSSTAGQSSPVCWVTSAR